MTENASHNIKEWELLPTDLFQRQIKKFLKKHHNESAAVLERLETYKMTLDVCDEPQQVIRGWLHQEPCGVKAITEKGKGGSLKATRLYLYPDKEKRQIILITIGDKDSQQEDIKICEDFVKKHRGL